MDSAAKYQIIRQTVLSIITGSRILLFVSRARGDNDNFSDYDFLVISPNAFTPQEKILMSTRIDRAIIAAVNIPIDLLLCSEDEVLQKQDLPGHIIRSALREGVSI